MVRIPSYQRRLPFRILLRKSFPIFLHKERESLMMIHWFLWIFWAYLGDYKKHNGDKKAKFTQSLIVTFNFISANTSTDTKHNHQTPYYTILLTRHHHQILLLTPNFQNFKKIKFWQTFNFWWNVALVGVLVHTHLLLTGKIQDIPRTPLCPS